MWGRRIFAPLSTAGLPQALAEFISVSMIQNITLMRFWLNVFIFYLDKTSKCFEKKQRDS